MSTTDATRRFSVLPEITVMSAGGGGEERNSWDGKGVKSFTDEILTSNKTQTVTDLTAAANGDELRAKC